MDPTFLLAALPDQYTLAAALIIIGCKILTIFVRPPEATSRWATPYQIVSMIALNIGWAANRLQVGKTGIMVPRDQADAGKEALASSGVTVLSKGKPDT